MPGEQAPRRFERAVALGLYEGGLARWVRAMKYENQPGLASPLGALLAVVVSGSLGPARAWRRSSPGGCRPVGWDAVVVPVPLHASRLRERGYNQAELIAAALARALRLPQPAGALLRREVTPPQASLDRHARLRNLRGAFVTGPRGAAGAVKGFDVLLVDDVLTTGATVQACSEVLLSAGARRVLGCVVAAGVPRRLWE